MSVSDGCGVVVREPFSVVTLDEPVSVEPTESVIYPEQLFFLYCVSRTEVDV